MNSRLKVDDDSSKNEVNISEVSAFIKNQVDTHEKEKGKDTYVLLMSGNIAKDAHDVPQAMLHVVINNPKTKD